MHASANSLPPQNPHTNEPKPGVPAEELLKQLELLKRQEEAQLARGGPARSLGYAHTQDVGGHCAVLLEAFKVRVEEGTIHT